MRLAADFGEQQFGTEMQIYDRSSLRLHGELFGNPDYVWGIEFGSIAVSAKLLTI